MVNAIEQYLHAAPALELLAIYLGVLTTASLINRIAHYMKPEWDTEFVNYLIIVVWPVSILPVAIVLAVVLVAALVYLFFNTIIPD